MADAFSFKTEKCLVWDLAKPLKRGQRSSPLFYFQNFEWHFVLKVRHSGYSYGYELFMVNESQQKLPRSFSFTSYINCEIGPFSFQTCEVTHVTNDKNIRIFYESSNERKIELLKAKEKMKIVMIFHGDVGSTLHLKSENDYNLYALSRDFSKLLDGDSYHDMEVKCENLTIKAHRNVLSTRSDVLSRMLKSNMVEGQTARMEIKDMKWDTLKCFLRYLYSGKLPELTQDHALSLYDAGDKYMVQELMKLCSDFLSKNLTTENACDMLILADAHSDQSFKDNIISFILANKIPLIDDRWKAFRSSQPSLAIEVFTQYYELENCK